MAWNGSDRINEGVPIRLNEEQDGHSCGGIWKGLAAGLSVIILACISIYFFIYRHAPQSAVQPSEIKQVQHKPDKSTGAKKESANPRPSPKNKSSTVPKANPPALESSVRGENVSAEKPAATNTLSDAEKAEREAKRPFKTSTEQVLNWIFNARVGAMPPLPPMRIPENEFAHLREILDRPIEILETDSAQRADSKEMVNLAKKEMKAYIDRGGDPNEFLQYYHRELKKAFEFRNMSAEEVSKACDRDDPEVVRDFFKAINQHLEAKGMDKITLSDKQRAQIGLTDDDDQDDAEKGEAK